MFRARLLTLLILFAACAGVAGAQSNSPDIPAKCRQAGPNGELPECISDGSGKWEVSYPGDSPAGGSGGDIAIFVVLGLLVSGGILVWKVSMARRMATEAGMDPGRATALTVLTEDGLDATYIASSLRGHRATEAAPATPTRSTGDRLRELENLRAEGLVTQAEYDARRRAIVESV